MTDAKTWGWPLMMIALAIAGCGDDGGSPEQDGAPGSDGGSGGGWQELESLPVSIQEIGVAAIDGKIYVLGGFIGGTITDMVHVYDIAGDSWSTVATLPTPIHHANVAVAGGKIYVVGALTGGNFAPIPDVYEYDPSQDEWTEKTPMPAAFARGASAIGVVDDIIYIAGGSGSGGSVDLMSAYDPAADTHDTELAVLPDTLNHLVGGGVGGTFYAIGGRDSGITGIKNTTFAYDPAADGWTEKAAMPTARGGMAAGVVGDRIIVVGGEGNAAESTGVFPQTESYDPASDQWTSLARMRTPRHGMGAAGVGDTLYVPGGANVQGFGAIDVVEAFTP